MSRERDQTIALAALIQVLDLVDALAGSGQIEETKLVPLLNSLFEFDPASAESVYGRLGNLRPGLIRLRAMLSGGVGNQSLRVTRYAMSVLFLARRLAADRDSQAIIRSRLQGMRTDFSSSGIEAMTEALAKLYQDTVSTYRHRIQVIGSPEQLRDRRVANCIRALLLAAVRAGILWQQTGGRRWRLLVYPKRYASWAKILLGESQASILR